MCFCFVLSDYTSEWKEKVILAGKGDTWAEQQLFLAAAAATEEWRKKKVWKPEVKVITEKAVIYVPQQILIGRVQRQDSQSEAVKQSQCNGLATRGRSIVLGPGRSDWIQTPRWTPGCSSTEGEWGSPQDRLLAHEVDLLQKTSDAEAADSLVKQVWSKSANLECFWICKGLNVTRICWRAELHSPQSEVSSPQDPLASRQTHKCNRRSKRCQVRNNEPPTDVLTFVCDVKLSHSQELPLLHFSDRRGWKGFILSSFPSTFSLFVLLSPQFSVRKTNPKKSHSSHSDREQGKTWPRP